jgi:hypothetical protein
MNGASVVAVVMLLVAGMVAALAVPIGHALAAPDVGDVKDGFTIAAMVIGQVFTAGAVYGAIRGDIKHLHYSVQSARESAKAAHERIDELYQGGVGGRSGRR